MEALYQLATGVGNIVAGVVNIPANRSGLGGAGFRKGALPVITMITDAVFHTKGESATPCSYQDGAGNHPVTSDYTGAVAAAALAAVNLEEFLQAGRAIIPPAMSSSNAILV